MSKTNSNVPTWEKYTLNITEAAQYFGIGEKKLRQLAEQNPPPNWTLQNGEYLRIKRKLLEKVIDEVSSI